MKNHFEKYLNHYAEKGPWKVTAQSMDGIRNVVVIPALAEYPGILETLHSLSLNHPEELQRTLIVCMVNNRPLPHAQEGDIANNRDTILMLHALIEGRTNHFEEGIKTSWIRDILDSNIRLAYIDASSPGLELPSNGGVGLARKIGMDLCLPLFQDRDGGQNLLFSLDADTLVEPNYLQAAVHHFRTGNKMAAAVSFMHRSSDDSAIQEAIAFYESYLRYYVIGLNYANSHYAFHTIGSTIVSTAEGYVIVRGMPKRLAAEDFYFLNKLAKVSPIGSITETTVFPSPRLSARTPFGTGNKIGQLIREEETESLLYAPQIFSILGEWLKIIKNNLDFHGEAIQLRAAMLDPGLSSFLKQVDFIGTWTKLRKNYPHQHNLLRQFHAWFDGLKTLKLIHYLTEDRYPKVLAGAAIERMKEMIESNAPKGNALKNPSSMTDMLSCLQAMEKGIKQRRAAQDISP